MSIYEETTISTLLPMMGVFNNLVIFDPKQAQNRLDNIIPDLAENWSSSDDGKQLTFKLRNGVKWHDGKPFTAHDVKCSGIYCSGGEKTNSGSTHVNCGGSICAKSRQTTTFK